MADFDVFGGDGCEVASASLRSDQNRILGVIQLLVLAVAIEVINSLLDHRHQEYEGKGSDVGEEESDLEERHELGEGDNQEEHVEEELELVVEHLGHEGEDVVLLVVQAVGAEV